MRATTLRFWDYVNGDYVKLSLRPGDVLRHSRAWEHDEGWSSECTTWEHDGAGVLSTLTTDGRDCDGRLSTFSEVYAPASDLQARIVEGAPAPMPEWERLDSHQRDYSAEAMGY